METSLDPNLRPPARRGRTRLWLVSALSALTVWMLLGTWRHTRRRVQAQQALISETNFRRAMENSMLTGQDANPQAPPRISLSAFKTLYDDPAQRPLILDVRGADQYAVGHIPGAQSFPESELDLREATLPTNRLIIAYCQ